MSFVVVAKGSHHVLRTQRGFLIGVFRTPMNEAVAADVARAVDAQTRDNAELSYLHIPDFRDYQGVKPEEVRALQLRLLKRFGTQRGAVALVIGNDGFVGAAVRAAFTSLVFVARPAIPIRAFASVGAAHAFLAAHRSSRGGSLPALAEVEAAVAAMRAETDGPELSAR